MTVSLGFDHQEALIFSHRRIAQLKMNLNIQEGIECEPLRPARPLFGRSQRESLGKFATMLAIGTREYYVNLLSSHTMGLASIAMMCLLYVHGMGATFHSEFPLVPLTSLSQQLLACPRVPKPTLPQAVVLYSL